MKPSVAPPPPPVPAASKPTSPPPPPPPVRTTPVRATGHSRLGSEPPPTRSPQDTAAATPQPSLTDAGERTEEAESAAKEPAAAFAADCGKDPSEKDAGDLEDFKIDLNTKTGVRSGPLGVRLIGYQEGLTILYELWGEPDITHTAC